VCNSFYLHEREYYCSFFQQANDEINDMNNKKKLKAVLKSTQMLKK